MKKCGKCNELKNINEFHKNSSRKDGHDTWCAKCSNDYNKSYYQDNIELKRANSRIRDKRYRNRAKTSLKIYTTLKAGKRKTDFSGKYLLSLYENNKSCYYCGRLFASYKDVQIEHKTPISRGGTLNKENIVLSCSHCNRLKWTMTEDEFMEFLELYITAIHNKMEIPDRGELTI